MNKSLLTRKKSKSPYRQAGVNVETGYKVVQRIKKLKTLKHPLMYENSIGMFAGGFDLSKLKYREPVLFSSVDGVGTKLLLAKQAKNFDTLGQDLVAMSVNDLICHGAKPLYFLDYYASGKTEINVIMKIIKNIALVLKDIDCALLGGETAEMPNLYLHGDFDIAGMATGICEKKKIITGQTIKAGQKIIALASSGLHANGYSLVRKLIRPHHWNTRIDNRPVIELLLKPTKIYVNAVLACINKFSIYGMANNTGGGIYENLPRCLPHRLGAKIYYSKIQIPSIFQYLQKLGKLTLDEMFHIFNMGMGYFMVADQNDVNKIIALLKEHNIKAYEIGEVHQSPKHIQILWKQ